MAEKKEEWEMGYSRENPPITPPTEAKTAYLNKPETLVGQMLDERFLIEKDLTEGGADVGGIGLVYLAKDLKLLGKEVVVKILQNEALKNENILRKFQHEKEALIRLDHPNIVRILDSGTLSDGNPFMVMEFIEGYSLRRKLRDNGKLPLSECAYLIEQIGNALSLAHSKKVLHRDIKPENVMLTPQIEGYERVRLIDFGIARVENSQLGAATSIPQAIGTVLYMAPEQLEGKLEQTPAADIYAMAIVAYETLTGELPFKPKSVIDMFMLQSQGVSVLPSQLRPEIPKETDKIILRALSINPADRPQDARQFAKDLANTLRQPITVNQPIPKTDSNIGATIDSNLVATEVDINNFMTSTPTMASPVVKPPPTQIVSDYKIPNIVPEDNGKKSNVVVYAAIGLLILMLVGGLLAFGVWKSLQPTVTVTANKDANVNTNTNVNTNSVVNINELANSNKTITPSREIIFYLNVQKMRDGKPFEEPFRSSGQEIFENGYKFKMNVKPDENGFIYLFNEEKDAQGATVFNILYPTPKTNNGLAEVKSQQPIETSFNTFGGTKGTELVWIIWTAAKQDDLESAKQSAFTNQGTIKEEKNGASVK